MNGIYEQVVVVDRQYRQAVCDDQSHRSLVQIIGDNLAPFLVVCACWGFVLATCLTLLH